MRAVRSSAVDVRFRDRAEAGRELAAALQEYAGRSDVVVLALPRGGVPVAYEVATALRAPLDVFVVRKLGLPGQPELAMGAIASGGIQILNEEVVEAAAVSSATIEDVAARERAELARRERLYRGRRAPEPVKGRVVLLVDDGVATGSTMRAAIRALREQRPARIVVAVPVAPPKTCEALHGEADDVLCLRTREPFGAISVWYESFPQANDDEIREFLERRKHARS
jgi:predicted phosphoribosyltransferase